MRVYFDTEFTALKAPADLISAGFITELGQEFYAEVPFNKTLCTEFVKQTVLPLLDAREDQRLSRGAFALHLADWLQAQADEIVLISDSNWDSEVLRPLFLPFGGLDELVPGARYGLVSFDDDCAARRYLAGHRNYFEQHPGKQHHALHDARALRQGYLRAEGFY